MSESPPDFNALARRYLDLWQEQVAAVAADPALAEAVARGVAMMTQSVAAVAEAAKVGGADDSPAPPGHEAKSHERTAPTSFPDGSPPPAAALDDPRFHHDELALRVAALEGRVARLEAALGGGRGGPDGKPRRRRA